MRVSTLRHLIAGLAVIVGLASAMSDLSAAETTIGKTYLLAIGVCPPYRHDIPVVVCKNAVDAVVKELGEALNIAKNDTVALVDEKATGPGINRRLHDREEYVLVFWTKEEPTVPALSLAQKEWLTVDEVVDAIDALPAKVALILESCSSGKMFTGFHLNAQHSERIDYVLVSAGAEQISNLNDAKTIPIFTASLTNALDLPMVDTFGEAVSHARMITTLRAAARCATMIMPQKVFSLIFPGKTVPNEITHDGMVSPPLWMCAQVPSVADFSGDMSGKTIYQNGSTEYR
jgi:SpoU rRNA methylase family enzyme